MLNSRHPGSLTEAAPFGQQDGHNCQIGRHNLLCSQVGIAGSVTTGDYVVMAGQVGVGEQIVERGLLGRLV